eukprot:9321999-Prorocentrum_lima.AAC.1
MIKQSERAIQFELQSELQAKDKVLDDIKQSVSAGDLALNYRNQACDWKDKHDDGKEAPGCSEEHASSY